MNSNRKEKVLLERVISEFNLEVIYAPDSMKDTWIDCADVHRPGIQFAADYYEYFDHSRIQVLGKAEMFYLMEKSSEEKKKILSTLCGKNIPAIVVTRKAEIPTELMETVRECKTPLLRTEESTSQFIASYISTMNVILAPFITRHGVLMEIYGEGVLILGESGVGKSETAVELVKRGHRLVADDAVEIKKVSAKTLVASSPEIIRHFIELRGIGIIDVKKIFGMGAVKDIENVNLVVNLELWQEGKNYERLGIDKNYTNILGIDVPSVTIPVRPGRNLAIIIEIAAMNFRQQQMGYNAAEELNERIAKQLNMDATGII
ncbi:MAG: HPr(Ser) kinase/phosphatase [Clostridia bacterium]|nr:HPr(Ser) kinase/phosphatase [Clostridia bacterium]